MCLTACIKFKIASMLMTSAQRFQSHNVDNKVNGSNSTQTSKEISERPLVATAEHLNIASAANAKYMEYLFSKWVQNKDSVDKSWDRYFNEIFPKNEPSPNAVESSKAGNGKTAASTDKKVKPKEAKPIESNTEVDDYIDLFAKLDKSTAPKSVGEEPESGLNDESDDENDVVYTITLTPMKEVSELDDTGFIEDVYVAPSSKKWPQIAATLDSVDPLSPASSKSYVSSSVRLEADESTFNLVRLEAERVENDDSTFNLARPDIKARLEAWETLAQRRRLKAALDCSTYSLERAKIRALIDLIEQQRFQRSLERQRRQKEGQKAKDSSSNPIE